MQNFQDNRPFVAMINNRPSLSIIPSVNKRILAQKWGIQGMAYFSIASILSIIGYKYLLDASSLYVVKSKKAFTF
jgi:hypothetical protein